MHGRALVILGAVLTVASLALASAASAASLKTLYKFCSRGGAACTDGALPLGDLIINGGTLYGTTIEGGAHPSPSSYSGAGTVFALIPNAAKTAWTRKTLYSFCVQENCTDGGGPVAGVIMDKAGKLYGTTQEGGADGVGTAFALTPNATKTKWTEAVLYNFCSQRKTCADGVFPLAGLIGDASGGLYGTTSEGGSTGSGSYAGTVFELKP